MKVAAHHADPGGAVAGVGVRLVQGHDVSEVGELGVLLLEAHLEEERRKTRGIFERREVSGGIIEREVVYGGEPGRSSQRRLGRTGWGRQSFARDAAAGREHSGEILEGEETIPSLH